MSKHIDFEKRVAIEEDNPSIMRDDSKCIRCGSCKNTCQFMQGVHGFYNLEQTGDQAICINCGQCSNTCPTGAITEKYCYKKVEEIINKNDKIVVFQTSPSVRVSISEMFGADYGTFNEGKMVSALKELGASYVFDTTFGADLTIMEEANELIERIKGEKTLPMFTSCCPAWVNFVETFYPEYIPNLSTVKSPILMQGAIIKTYFADKMNIPREKIINVAVTPCTAKKGEILRDNMNACSYESDENLRDMDYIITARELGMWIKERKIDFNNLTESNYDSLFSKGSGAGVIFGNSGGVMEAALRTAYYIINKELPNDDFLSLTQVRSLSGIKEATVNFGNISLEVAIISGTNNARKFLKMLKESNKHYDFVEVMACSGGCINGGGQPKFDLIKTNEVKEKRQKSLYKNDTESQIRNSFENPDIIKVYDEYLNSPLSDKSKFLLHTSYKDNSNKLECIKK